MDFIFETPYRHIAIFVTVFFIVGAYALVRRWLFEDSITAIDGDDPELLSAFARARAGLPDFWSRFAAPRPNEVGFALKVRFVLDNGRSELPWIEPIARHGSQIQGRLLNDPLHLKMKHGDIVDCDEKDIVDWTYLRNGKYVGGETMRLAMQHVSPGRAK